MIPRVIQIITLGIVGGCIYGLLLIRHSRIKSSFVSEQVSPTRLAIHYAFASIARLLFFIVLGIIVLRFAPQHFILMVGIFVGSLWLTIVVTQKGNQPWRGLL